MWARKRIDIRWPDLVAALGNTLAGRRRERLHESVAQEIGDDAVPCLSVRSGLDAVFSVLDLPRGSEILVSDVTIPDIVRIVQEHGLVPVPVPLTERDVSVSADAVRRAMTPRTRMLIVAHLFGAVMPLDDVAAVAAEHDILLFEDCAQAFDGCYYGHDSADIVAFSFGPIKTATALGGAVLRIREASLRDRFVRRCQDYPAQSRLQFLKRLLKYSGLWLMGHRLLFGLLVRWLERRGRDVDVFLSNSVRNFGSDTLFDTLRFRMSLPMLRLLVRRLRRFDRTRIDRRADRGRTLVSALKGVAECPGSRAAAHSFWVFPARVPKSVCMNLRRAGFDATSMSQLRVVRPGPDGAGGWLAETIFLPLDADMQEADIARMSQVVVNAISGSGMTSEQRVQ